MASVRTRLLRLTAAASLAAFAGSALAASTGMSGGGGGAGSASSMPSVSAPTYDPAAEYRRGLDALKAGKFRDAEDAFDHVLTAAPKNGDVWLLMGLSKEGKGDIKGAEKAYEKSVKLEPDNITAHQQLGMALAKLNQSDKAKAELDLLQQKASACGSCADADKLKAAVTAVQGAMGGAPSAQLTPPSLLFATPAQGDNAYVEAVSLINAHRYSEALASLAEVQKAFGPHPDVLTYIGYTYRKLGQYDVAEGYYRQALAIAPGHRGATEYYGELKVERGDMAGARRMLAALDSQCAFGCAEAETLRLWIQKGGDPGL
jgi:tetratricopeptide (TPR) repeat protein